MLGIEPTHTMLTSGRSPHHQAILVIVVWERLEGSWSREKGSKVLGPSIVRGEGRHVGLKVRPTGLLLTRDYVGRVVEQLYMLRWLIYPRMKLSDILSYYRRCNSQTPYILQMEHTQAHPMSASDVSRSLQSLFEVELQPPIGRAHSCRYSILY